MIKVFRLEFRVQGEEGEGRQPPLGAKGISWEEIP